MKNTKGCHLSRSSNTPLYAGVAYDSVGQVVHRRQVDVYRIGDETGGDETGSRLYRMLLDVYTIIQILGWHLIFVVATLEVVVKPRHGAQVIIQAGGVLAVAMAFAGVLYHSYGGVA